MKNKTTLALLAAIAIALITGCSGPSTDDAQKTLSQYLESQSGGQIKLVSFKKTDGQKALVEGVEGYSLSYEADITFVSNGYWYSHENGYPGLTFGFSTRVGALRMNGETQVQAGSHVKIGGVMLGQKSEKGWTFEVGDSHQM